MTRMTFAERLKALGLAVPEAELAPLERMVTDLEAAARQLRVPRPVAQEPATVFRLRPEGAAAATPDPA